VYVVWFVQGDWIYEAGWLKIGGVKTSEWYFKTVGGSLPLVNPMIQSLRSFSFPRFSLPVLNIVRRVVAHTHLYQCRWHHHLVHAALRGVLQPGGYSDSECSARGTVPFPLRQTSRKPHAAPLPQGSSGFLGCCCVWRTYARRSARFFFFFFCKTPLATQRQPLGSIDMSSTFHSCNTMALLVNAPCACKDGLIDSPPSSADGSPSHFSHFLRKLVCYHHHFLISSEGLRHVLHPSLTRETDVQDPCPC